LSAFTVSERVPAAPLLEILERAIEQAHYIERETEDGIIMEGGATIVAMRLGYSCGRRIAAIRKQKYLSFDLADKIVCKLTSGGFLTWLTHPELAPIYEGLQLQHNQRDFEILGDQAALAELQRRREYNATANRKRSKARDAKRKRREAERQAVESLDVLESVA